MKKIALLVIAACWTTAAILAANRQETVKQVTTEMTLTDDVDLHITSDNPFGDNGTVNIVNIDKAVIILDQVKPSQLKSTILSNHVFINGVAARNNENCQVRIYDRGCIIFPYSKTLKPLTVFTKSRCTGDSCNNFNFDSDNGFMNTMTAEQLNNQIKSFRLKRGHMVTFSLLPKGAGYSRCFIADKEDLVVNLPQLMTDKISSYRLFKWYNVSKTGWGGSQSDINSALNTTWCYDWGAGTPSFLDREYVTHHHDKWWPGIDEVGRNGSSAHALGDNEPDNGAGGEVQSSVSEVLSTWEKMMATGKRLGSPAVAGNAGWVAEFLDSIDARGWRCDFVAVHAYWYNDAGYWQWLLGEYHDNYSNGRPIWITEMNWGAGWTGWPGSNRDGNATNYNIEYNGFKPILDYLASDPNIERYAPFNLWEDCYKFHNGGDQSLKDKNYLTPIGEYYSKMNPGLAFQATREFLPRNPRTYAPEFLYATPKGPVVTLRWREKNGELSREHWFERKRDGESEWTRYDMPVEETATYYSVRDTLDAVGGYTYRVGIKDFNFKTQYSKEIKCEITTGISNPQSAATRKEKVYDLSGKRQDKNQLRRGVYISSDGKKFFKR